MKPLKVLVACEFSGIVRDAFAARGHDAWSCDLLPTEKDGQHFECDIISSGILTGMEWDLIIAHPPCTYLCCSGARWFKDRKKEQQAAIDFFKIFTRLPCPYIIENPIGIMSTQYRKPDQIIQPWMFGHGETKATCLWLNRLQKLQPSCIVGGREPRIHFESPGPDRSKNRSRTYSGIAKAMAEQYG